MKIAAILALGLVLVVMGIEIVQFLKESNATERELSRVEEKLSGAKKEAASLEANVEYYRHPANLEKEMRARFNYRGEGEKLLILVPRDATSSSATSTLNSNP